MCMNSIVCLEQHICSYIEFKLIHYLMWYPVRFRPYTSSTRTGYMHIERQALYIL